MRTMILLLLLIPLGAFGRDWQVDAAHSSLAFKGSYQGQAFDGKFKKFDALIAYDEVDPSKAKFDVKIDLGSVDTQSSERDDTLRTADFFDVAKFPQAHFVTTTFTKAADGSVEAKGTLTIRDQTKPVTLKVKFAVGGSGATVDVDAALNRQDFALGVGSDWADVANAVSVHGHLALTGK